MLNRSLLLALFLFAAPLLGHHNTDAVFDTSKSVTLKGTITSLNWRNPHTSLVIDVRDAGGKLVSWNVELYSSTNLMKAGLEKDSIDLTKSYSIEIFPAKDGSKQGVGITLTFPDGKTFDVGDKPAAK
jgi:hypothetical protein